MHTATLTATATATQTAVSTSVTNEVNKGLLAALIVMIVLLLMLIGAGIGLWVWKRRPRGYGATYRIRDDSNMQANTGNHPARRPVQKHRISHPLPGTAVNTHRIEMNPMPTGRPSQAPEPGPSRPVTPFAVGDPEDFEDLDWKSEPPSYKTEPKPGHF